MAFLGKEFNIEDIEQKEGDFELLKEGWYDATINQIDLKDSSTGGKHVSISYLITGPTYQGRIVFENIVVSHQDAKTERIGQDILTRVGAAIGKPVFSDTDDLMGGNLSLFIIIDQGNEKYPKPTNKVKKVRSIQSSSMPLNQKPNINDAPWVKK